MKIRKYFGLCNFLMFALPVTIIAIISIAFIVIFILNFPVEDLYMSRVSLLQPLLLIEVMGKFLRENPMALGYIILWIGLCIAVLAVTTTSVTRRMSQKITRSLSELTEAADRVRGGDLAFEIIGSDMEEIDELCASFDDMRRSLLNSEKREEAMKHERSMLIANISHDLKTPVTAIKGYIDAIGDGLAEDPEKLMHYLKIIKSKNNAIENLVSNLSTMSRLELSRLEMTFAAGDLNDLLYDVVFEYRLDAELAGLELKAELCAEPAPVSIDYDKMLRVMVNLIENSIKYRRPDSKKIVVKSEVKEDHIFAYVIDDGMGIAAEEADKIFGSFYRVDEARTSQIKGSGLGLGIARQIVEKHGGRLWLMSDGIGKGATAVISLNRSEQNPEGNKGV